uniref:subtilisin n=1 Tax=Bicosoecida sp. CB-2014 TaxID=1486930 RepID=A0A7S1CNE9_9STRA
MAVSDPDSPRYGQHLTFEQVGEMFADPVATAAVHAFLDAHGVEQREQTPHGEYIRVVVDAEVANAMLDTVFHDFESEGQTITRAAGYSLPAEVAEYVNFVGYVTTFPRLNMRPVFHSYDASSMLRGRGLQGASGVATPQIISQYYGIDNNTVSTTKASQALFETIGQSYEPSDLAAFDQKYSLPKQKISKVIGPNDPSSCSANPNNCIEAELDVQQITAIAQDTHTTFWSIPGTESFLEWAQAVAAASDPPLVHSISYGSPESDTSAPQAKSFDDEIAKLGARGITVFVASGDDGVAGAAARGNPGACGFNPSYPATAPHVTAVGATQGPEAGTTEVACSSNTGGGITTGGGFSAIYPQPSWQSSQVAGYLANAPNLPPKSMFASTGRGYPDVAAMGHNYVIAVGGQFYQGSGTSASTPVFGAMITLINAARIEAGKSSLGFLNPALYKISSDAFHPITSGENNCAAGSPGSNTCCQYGFTATTGWTPLTGLGSPKFPTLKSELMAM